MKEKRFYLIGTRTNDRTALPHELRHAPYYLNAGYRREVNDVLRQFPAPSFKRRLQKMGYGENVIADEKQAYALTGWPSELSVTKKMATLKKALREVEERYLHLLPPQDPPL